MTRSAPGARRGSQPPRVESVPDGRPHGDFQDALDLVEAAGLILDPWQRLILEKSLLRRAGRWAAFEVGVVAPRQNGKNALIEARELAGLFVLRERLLIHSAHQVDTSLEAFRRLLFLIESNDWLMAEVAHVRRTNGQEEIETVHGSRIRFRTRTKGGGRGFSADCVVFDEAMIFPEPSLGAIMPVVSARPDPQLWYTGSAVDQTIHVDGLVLARLRNRALRGGDPSLAYFEWSIDGDTPDDVPEEVAADPAAWQQANPALGIRISEEHVGNEQRSMDPRTFAVERLGVGDWPDPDGGGAVIDTEQWRSLVDQESEPRDPVCLALDVNPNRTWASVAAAGFRPDGLQHVELVARHKGTRWCADRIVELVERHRPLGVVVEESSPAGPLVHELEERGVKVTLANSRQHAYGCGLLFDAIDQAKLRHIGQPDLSAAVRGAVQRPYGDAWAWSRKNSAVDISPLVACTLAHWGSVTNLGTHRRGTPRAIDLSTI